jgi:hypothetical protein
MDLYCLHVRLPEARLLLEAELDALVHTQEMQFENRFQRSTAGKQRFF